MAHRNSTNIMDFSEFFNFMGYKQEKIIEYFIDFTSKEKV